MLEKMLKVSSTSFLTLGCQLPEYDVQDIWKTS